MNDTASIVSRVWSFCHTLRDDGVSYGDYLEQLTYLLFLKMADEYSRIYKKDVGIPEEYRWDSLKTRKGADLEAHYITLLRSLGKQKGMIGQIFVKSQNQIQDLKDFIACYNPRNRHQRKETWTEDNPDGRWRRFSYDEITARDKTSLDIFWIRDESLADLDNLPDPDVLAEEIVENLEAGAQSFRRIVESINGR